MLGFDPYKILTFRDKDIRKEVAKAKAKDEAEAIADPVKSAVYYKYMDPTKVKMVGYLGANGDYIKGIEDYIPNSQYKTEEHQSKVVEDILDNWVTLSRGGKFHAIFCDAQHSGSH